MNIFDFRSQLIGDYASYIKSFIQIRDPQISLRYELDAAYFHLYSTERDNVDYIMETFPIVKRKDEKQYGEYRTKRVILEIYDEMRRAMETGEPYRTRLEPPPADAAVAHGPRAGVEVV